MSINAVLFILFFAVLIAAIRAKDETAVRICVVILFFIVIAYMVALGFVAVEMFK